MAEPEAARLFQGSGEKYDQWMGRYSRALAPRFAEFCGLQPGRRFLDVGCGPGALTLEAVARLGAGAVVAIDPSPDFVRACAEGCPGVDVRSGSAEAVPLPDDDVDCAAAQLVFHFVPDPPRALAELIRVVRPGGVIATAVWDFGGGMQLLRSFWDAALAVDPTAPDEATTLKLHREGEQAALFAAGGLVAVEETTSTVSSEYRDFDELWGTVLFGIGPAGAYALAQPGEKREAVRAELARRLGWTGDGPFVLEAVARVAKGRLPGGSQAK